MVFNLSKFSDDLDYIIADMPTTITIAGTDYICTKRKLTNDQVYNTYGYGDEYSFSVHLNINDLSSIPDNHTLITIDSVEYRIMGKEIDSADTRLQLHLKEKFGVVK